MLLVRLLINSGVHRFDALNPHVVQESTIYPAEVFIPQITSPNKMKCISFFQMSGKDHTTYFKCESEKKNLLNHWSKSLFSPQSKFVIQRKSVVNVGHIKIISTKKLRSNYLISEKGSLQWVNKCFACSIWIN